MTETAAPRRLSQTEFIALTAMMFATIAFSIDSMLPSMPVIAAELTPDAPNRAQLILTSFMIGMGIGTFAVGPMADAFGRKTVILSGAVLYCVAAAAAFFAPTLDTIIAARVVQGLGAAAPRIVSLAMVRDLYQGRQMARIVSFAMMIFTLVPAIAPFMATGIIALTGWRGLFAAFVCFSLISSLWLGLRQPETLHPEDRRPLSLTAIGQALRQILTNRVVVTSIGVQIVTFGCLFGNISSIQQIYDRHFGMADSFPAWFAANAVLAGTSSFVNARLVVRLGMRRIVTATLTGLAILSVVTLALFLTGALPQGAEFPVYFLWSVSVFFSAGLVMGNLNALALEPMGHIAGTAASTIGCLATVGGALIAAPIGLAFDGTPVPLIASVTVLAGLGMAMMHSMPKR